MSVLHRANRTISLTLAFLVFFASSAFVIDVHYCQGRVKSFSVFGKAKDCNGLGSEKMSCAYIRTAKDPSDHGSFSKNQCCKDKLFYIQSGYDLILDSIYSIKSVQLQSFITPYFGIPGSYLKDTDTPADFLYKPPLILRDIPVLLQSFLL